MNPQHILCQGLRKTTVKKMILDLLMPITVHLMLLILTNNE